jgi:chemotaxis protein MotB
MKRKGHRAQREDDSNPFHDASWLYSYADLMTQLLIFSILLIAVLGVKPIEMQKLQPEKKKDLQEMEKQVENLVKENSEAFKDVSLDRAADRLVIRMKSAILFKEAQDGLTREAERVLDGLAPILAKGPSKLRVEGHTDDVPIRSTQFPSNWELSTARAISVVRYLEDHGVTPDRLSVAGYAEFHPLAPNDGAANRAVNRRVEIVVLGG